MTPGPADDVARVSERLGAAGRVLVLSGAGISAESGIPTFRGRDGWWRREDPSKLATAASFRRDPGYVWEWYQYRRELVAGAEPNEGHRAVARWESEGRDVLVATQNVDDLHERAGSRGVVHIHGSLWRVRCFTCGGSAGEDRSVPFPELPPRCEACGGALRPDVVWFGEALPEAPLAAVGAFVQEPVDVAFVVGTEASFPYIVHMALAAREAGALLVEVNPSRTPLSDAADVRLRGPAGRVLPGLGVA